MISADSNIYVTKTKQQTQIKLTPLEGEIQNTFSKGRKKWRSSNDVH
jgi:hypothetical protein